MTQAHHEAPTRRLIEDVFDFFSLTVRIFPVEQRSVISTTTDGKSIGGGQDCSR
jgi:hypothetical protein